MSRTLRSKAYKTYYHNGIWEKSKFDEEDWVWSCC